MCHSACIPLHCSFWCDAMRSVWALFWFILPTACRCRAGSECVCPTAWHAGAEYCYKLMGRAENEQVRQLDTRCHWLKTSTPTIGDVTLPVLQTHAEYRALQQLLKELREGPQKIPHIYLDLSFDHANSDFTRSVDYGNMKAWKWYRGVSLEKTGFERWKPGHPTPNDDHIIVTMDQQGFWVDEPMTDCHNKQNYTNNKLSSPFYVCQTKCQNLETVPCTPEIDKPKNQTENGDNNSNFEFVIALCVIGGALALATGISIAIYSERRKARKKSTTSSDELSPVAVKNASVTQAKCGVEPSEKYPLPKNPNSKLSPEEMENEP